METPDKNGKTRQAWIHQAVETSRSGNTMQCKHQAGVETSDGVGISGRVEILVKRTNNRRVKTPPEPTFLCYVYLRQQMECVRIMRRKLLIIIQKEEEVSVGV